MAPSHIGPNLHKYDKLSHVKSIKTKARKLSEKGIEGAVENWEQ